MSLLLDTNILVFLSKEIHENLLATVINPEKRKVYISVATVGELYSLGLQNQWGRKKWAIIEDIISDFVLIEVNETLIGIYSQIDSYSQRKNPSFKDYPFSTPRNMGKNDLWIAATAALLNLTLITTDKDFDHLHETFFNVKRLSPQDL